MNAILSRFLMNPVFTEFVDFGGFVDFCELLISGEMVIVLRFFTADGSTAFGISFFVSKPSSV